MPVISENAYLPTGDLALWHNNPPAYTGDNRNCKMSTLLPFLALDQPCDQAVVLVSEQLANAGFRVVETFDLQVARQAHSDCPCPHHGTERCNCQLSIFLVYIQQQENPVTMVIHGQDDKTWLSMANPVGQRANQALEATLRRALSPLPTRKPAVEEVADEIRKVPADGSTR